MADWKRIVERRLAPLGLNRSAEAALVDEIGEHLDDLYTELRTSGASAEGAYRETIAELDDMYPLRVSIDRSQMMSDTVVAGQARSGSPIDDLRQDLKYARSTMRANPLFTLFVVVTLGLAIGANTMVFTLINGLLLNPLPADRPEELVAVAAVETAGQSPSAPLLPISFPNFSDYQSQATSFASLAAYTGKRVLTLQRQGASEGVLTEFVTGNYFSTLGVRAAAGRFFAPDEDRDRGTHPVAVLNYGAWQRRFGGRDMIGAEVRLNGLPVTVIGVAPPGFIGVNGLVGPDLWLPFAMAERLLPSEMKSVDTDRAKPVLLGVARLGRGVTMDQANANVAALATGLARAYPAANDGFGGAVRPIADALLGSTMIGVASLVLAVVVGIVLLIACSNVANLLLARAMARSQETAVRVALGASRGRLVRQLLTESTCLGLLSGGLGLLIGYSGVRLLSRMLLPMSGTFVAPSIDINVLLFTLAASLVTGVVFGIVPALNAARAASAEALKESRTGAGRRRVTIGRALLVGQVALSFLLLVTAALFLRSIQRAYDIDPGFQTAHLAVFLTNPGQAGFTDAQTRTFYTDVRARVAALPGVESASWSSNLPLWARPATGIRIEGQPTRSRSDSSASIVLTVDTGYFATTGIAVDRGRDFTDVDRSGSLPVAIVNATLAADYWPGENPIGRRLQVPGDTHMREIVGVARTANYTGWAEAPQRAIYVPLEQSLRPSMALYVRSTRQPEAILGAVGREIASAGPAVLVSGIRTGREIVDGGLFQARAGVMLLGVFGLLALGLASIGLFGNLAFAVTERQREIGLRMALGANRSDVRALILKQGLSLVMVGLIIGAAASLVVGRLLSGLLFGIGGSDPVSLAGAAGVLCLVALLACYLPARWATRVDPLLALRHV